MVRSDIVRAIADKNPHLTVRQVERVVSTFFEAVIDQLVGGGRVEFRGFGTFSTRARIARFGRDPRNGDQVAVAAKRVPHFTPSEAWRVKL